MSEKIGYHLRTIEKQRYGTREKIFEEYEELLDAEEQDNPIMATIELSDMYGAIEEYAQSMYGLSMKDLQTMSDATKRAFKNGHRKADH